MTNYKLMEQVLTDEAALRQNIFHPDWRVRYAAAIAMGEDGSEKWLDFIYELLLIEEKRDLYSQPKAEFPGSYDDTRMAEQLIPITVVFDKEYPEEIKEDWRCRGRVRQACLFAVYNIGKATDAIRNAIYKYITNKDEDSAVKSAGAMALGAVGDEGSIPYLEKAMEYDEYCTRVECKKALAKLKAKYNQKRIF